MLSNGFSVNLSKLSNDDLSKSVSEYLSERSLVSISDYSDYVGKYVCIDFGVYKFVCNVLGYRDGVLFLDGYSIGVGHIRKLSGERRRVDVSLIRGTELLSSSQYGCYGDELSGFVSECSLYHGRLLSVVSGSSVEFERSFIRPFSDDYFKVDLSVVSGDVRLCDLYNERINSFRKAIVSYDEIFKYNSSFVGGYYVRGDSLYHCLGVNDYDCVPYGDIFSLSDFSLYTQTDVKFVSSLRYVKVSDDLWHACEGLRVKINSFYANLR